MTAVLERQAASGFEPEPELESGPATAELAAYWGLVTLRCGDVPTFPQGVLDGVGPIDWAAVRDAAVQCAQDTDRVDLGPTAGLTGAALSRLRPEFRSVMAFVDLLDMELPEVASIEGLDVASVERVLAGGHRVLAHALASRLVEVPLGADGLIDLDWLVEPARQESGSSIRLPSASRRKLALTAVLRSVGADLGPAVETGRRRLGLAAAVVAVVLLVGGTAAALLVPSTPGGELARRWTTATTAPLPSPPPFAQPVARSGVTTAPGTSAPASSSTAPPVGILGDAVSQAVDGVGAAVEATTVTAVSSTTPRLDSTTGSGGTTATATTPSTDPGVSTRPGTTAAPPTSSPSPSPTTTTPGASTTTTAGSTTTGSPATASTGSTLPSSIAPASSTPPATTAPATETPTTETTTTTPATTTTTPATTTTTEPAPTTTTVVTEPVVTSPAADIPETQTPEPVVDGASG